ncbi:hypothetical protein AX16_001015 [Volvariella volvacea WC 439]|nr:hypothetical protein AX16_001015 [Volvariella volvacea WC 439]
MLTSTTLPLGLVLITPFRPSLLDPSSCLTPGFRGNYHDGNSQVSLILPTQSCLDSWTSGDLISSASIVPFDDTNRQLVWLEEAAVDERLRNQTPKVDYDLDHFLDSFAVIGDLHPEEITQESSQVILPDAQPQLNYEILYRTPTAALLSLSSSRAVGIDQIISRFWKSTLVPNESVSYIPVPPSAVKRVEDVLSELKFNPEIAAIVNNISLPQMQNDIRFLTGEDDISPILSRHSFSAGARTAAAWLKDRFEDTGATCTLCPFLDGFAPNVICRYPAVIDTTDTVIISAHYDSRGSFGSTRAPGGDDDGSGTTGLLGIARTISRKGVRFHSNVELVAFAGEEQGLLGSRAYAKLLREQEANVTLMIQADMLAYRAPDEPAQLGLPDRIGTPQVAELVARVAAIYSPELTVGFTTACCSDHQVSFC